MAGWTDASMTLPQYQTLRFAHMLGGANDFAEPLTPNGALKKSSKVRG